MVGKYRNKDLLKLFRFEWNLYNTIHRVVETCSDTIDLLVHDYQVVQGLVHHVTAVRPKVPFEKRSQTD